MAALADTKTVESTKECLEQINSKKSNEKKAELLVSAAKFGHLDSVKYLIENGTPVNVISDGITPLAAIVRQLTNINYYKGTFYKHYQYEEEYSRKILVLQNEYQNVIHYLLSQGANPLTAADTYAGDVLTHVREYWLFIAQDQNLTLTDTERERAINFATDLWKKLISKIDISQVNRSVMEQILRASFLVGPNVILEPITSVLVGTDLDSWVNTLLYTDWSSDESIINVSPTLEFLLQKGANPSRVLMDVAKIGNLKDLKTVLKYNPNIEQRDESNLTPLMVISRSYTRDKVAKIQLLLDHHADVNAEDDKGNTALLHLVSNPETPNLQQLIMLLLNNDANPTHANHNGETAAYLAAFHGCSDDIVQLLTDAAESSNRFSM
ncbi:MAG TPA: ankyrin repeat domain-containing protein [Legionellaceae bacterium]|nr:ankyrin repeat domain-containing protein [Legionellaceae bacterium]